MSKISAALKTTPKVILHTHLEGSVLPDTLKLLSLRNGISLTFNPFDPSLYKIIEANNWNSFRKIYYEICSCFNTEQDFHDALYQYGVKLKNENVIYAEIQFSPWKHLSRGVPLERLSNGFISAIDKLRTEHTIIITMICDLVRHPDEDCEKIISWLKELPKTHFVGLGISGGSNAVERVHYKKYCEKVKKHDFKITAHAGELEGAESVHEIINYFQVDRIGHGIRSIEDTLLVDRLTANKMHFEICPTANKVIGLCRDNFQPVQSLVNKGINFSINPDDELIFVTDVSKELEIMIDENIITLDDVSRIQKNSLLNAFAIPAIKEHLLTTFFND